MEDAQQLASRLSTVLSELQDVMQQRKDRIEEPQFRQRGKAFDSLRNRTPVF